MSKTFLHTKPDVKGVYASDLRSSKEIFEQAERVLCDVSEMLLLVRGLVMSAPDTEQDQRRETVVIDRGGFESMCNIVDDLLWRDVYERVVLLKDRLIALEGENGNHTEQTSIANGVPR